MTSTPKEPSYPAEMMLNISFYAKLWIITQVLHVCSLIIRNYETTSYPYSIHSGPVTTTMSPSISDRSPYGNSFANPTSLTSFFSPDRYTHFSNFLSPNIGGIKLIPPTLTNHIHQNIPTRSPPTSLPSSYSSSFYGSTTPSHHLPTSASIESMDSSPVIVRPKKPTRRPLVTSSLYEASPSIEPLSTPTLLPSHQQDVAATKPSKTVVQSGNDSTPGSLGLLYVCKYF